jgi:hypothetical protein
MGIASGTFLLQDVTPITANKATGSTDFIMLLIFFMILFFSMVYWVFD